MGQKSLHPYDDLTYTPFLRLATDLDTQALHILLQEELTYLLNHLHVDKFVHFDRRYIHLYPFFHLKGHS